MENVTLQTPYTRGALTFKNRIFMAPMTRSRAMAQVPNDLMATYYAQRASAGLIFTEASQISPQGVGYIFTPGIHTQEQMEGWRKVTSAVHGEGGKIYLQLWHVGRMSHPDFHGGHLPVAPSAIGFEGQVFTHAGFKDTVAPRALSLEEIPPLIAQYKHASMLAKEAGFDGVEIHGANGYLPHQFLEDGSNTRTDAYGGSVQNRARFLLEVTKAVMEVWEGERISVRLSPRNPVHGMHDTRPEETYLYVVEQLEALKIGMLHVLEPINPPGGVPPLAPDFRKCFSGLLVLNLGYTQETAEKALESGLADAVSFGTLFISNPDLPERFRTGHPLAEGDRDTFYGGGEKGYIDYPAIGG